MAHIGQERALGVAGLLGQVPLPAQVAALVDDGDVDRRGDAEERQADDLVVPAERAVRAAVEREAQRFAPRHHPGYESAVLEHGGDPGDDAHPDVLPQAGERQGQEVGAKEHLPVGDGELLPRNDKGHIGRAHDADVEHAGEESQPPRRGGPAGERQHGDPQQQGHQRGGQSDPGLRIGGLGEEAPERSQGRRRGRPDPDPRGEELPLAPHPGRRRIGTCPETRTPWQVHDGYLSRRRAAILPQSAVLRSCSPEGPEKGGSHAGTAAA